jgi:hypothetical protein
MAIALPEQLDRLDKVRFFVVDESGNSLSSVWFLRGEGQGLYVAPSVLGPALKLSFHPLGRAKDGCDCQFGHPRDYSERVKLSGYQAMRPIRWSRGKTPNQGVLHAASIFFPTDRLASAPMPNHDGKLKFALPRAPSGMAVEAGIFFSKQNPIELEQFFHSIGSTPLTFSDFPGNEYVSLAFRYSESPAFVDFSLPLGQGWQPLPGEVGLKESSNARAIIASNAPSVGRPIWVAEVGPVVVRNGLL